MYILIISRGVPSKYHPQWGCFEKDQAEALAAYGHKVVVISVDARFKRHKGHLGLHQIINNGVKYCNYVVPPAVLFTKVIGHNSYQKKIAFRYYDKMYSQVVKNYGIPDVIYSHFFSLCIYGVLLKQKYNIPLVGIEHLARFNMGSLTKETEQGATFAFRGVDQLICVSKSLADNIKKQFGVQSTVVYNTIGNEFLRNVHIKRNNDKFIFVSIGTLEKRKGFDILLNAFAQSGLRAQNCFLKIIGEGAERQSLEAQIKKLDLENCVELLGRKDKNGIIKILSESNVFVLSSRVETFGVVCIESLAMGMPNIATICGGPEEIITPKNGILVSPENVDELSAAMQKMYQNYSSYNQLVIAEDCRKRFSPAAIAEELTAVFEDTIQRLQTNK